MAGDGNLYRVLLDEEAVDRGEQIICEIVTGVCQVVQVRVVESTAALYKPGQCGVVPLKRLVQVRR